jgi:hypothetical protein
MHFEAIQLHDGIGLQLTKGYQQATKQTELDHVIDISKSSGRL